MCAECYLALPEIKLKICRAESPMDEPLTAGLIGVSHATDCPFLWLRHKKRIIVSSFFQVSPGLTHRGHPCLSCVCALCPGREDLSQPQRSQWGLYWSRFPPSGVYPRATSYSRRGRKTSYREDFALGVRCALQHLTSWFTYLQCYYKSVQSVKWFSLLSLRKCNVHQPWWLWKPALSSFGPCKLSGLLEKLSKPQQHNLPN